MTRAPKRPPHISQEDWDAVDSPELTAEDFAKMRPATEVLPPELKRAIGERGPGKKPAKVAVSLRLDRDVVARFKKTGDGWQSRINAVLKEHAPRSAPAKRAAKRATKRA